MVDFINEVQEELRRDDYSRWLRRYGPYALGALVAVLILVGFLEWRDSKEASAARATSVAYTDAAELVDTDPDAALAAFERLADGAPGGYRGLALLRASALEVEAGDVQEAVALLDRAANAFEAPRHVQLAQLKAAYILAGEGRHGEVRTRLGPLVAEGAPYEFLARELDALSALEQGDAAAARRQLTYLATIPGVSPNVAERAQQALSLLSAGEAAETAEDTSGSSAADTDSTEAADDAADDATEEPTQ